MAKLNQIVAVVAGKKTRLEKELGELNKTLQKPDLFNGFSRRYEPLDAEGEQLPPEVKLAQKSVREVLEEARRILGGIMDPVATQEYANCQTKAAVTVGGIEILADVPVTVLLYLEKVLNDIYTLVGNVPTLDPTERWTADGQSGGYVTEPTKTHRTKKISKPIVLYPATQEHPAQTQLVQEDVLAGYWTTIKSSAAMSAADKRAIQERIAALLEAVKVAREEANSIEAAQKSIAKPVLDYIFGKSAV